ncbi:hypothetical protein [Streptomyces sp. H27-S2]|uniref:hypothetical protein n=1 Tax=Streptomyces antarcticus TaxID=2996458 RepID=UPI0022714E91|nr:hypothetical protein [Streptomyces sp. H27-S2]MCY0955162.1 hypothetical protein [Streptomyces sp. H27-S2]
MKEHRRATAWHARLLLCAALLLGIVTMHSLGHPAEHGSSPMPGHAVVADAPAPLGHAPEPLSADGPRAEAPAPVGGMDPLSVCLAVLSVWTVALLTARVLSRRTGDPALSALVRPAHALWPIPPPASPRTLLAQSSLLRI